MVWALGKVDLVREKVGDGRRDEDVFYGTWQGPYLSTSRAFRDVLRREDVAGFSL